MQRVVFDRYCKTAVTEVNGVLTAYDDHTHFIDKVGFDFPEAQRVFVEVEREHFVVERSGGVISMGRDLPEVQWILDHLDELAVAGAEVNASREVVFDWDDYRRAYLFNTDWLVLRHTEQLTTGSTTLTNEQYAQLIAYRQALRDMTSDSDFPTPPLFVQLN